MTPPNFPHHPLHQSPRPIPLLLSHLALPTMPKESLEELQYASYWDRRYRAEQSKPTSTSTTDTPDNGITKDDSTTETQEENIIPAFEWFRDFAKLKPFLEKYLPREKKTEKRLMHLGCGNSVSCGCRCNTIGVESHFSYTNPPPPDPNLRPPHPRLHQPNQRRLFCRRHRSHVPEIRRSQYHMARNGYP